MTCCNKFVLLISGHYDTCIFTFNYNYNTLTAVAVDSLNGEDGRWLPINFDRGLSESKVTRNEYLEASSLSKFDTEVTV